MRELRNMKEYASEYVSKNFGAVLKVAIAEGVQITKYGKVVARLISNHADIVCVDNPTEDVTEDAPQASKLEYAREVLRMAEEKAEKFGLREDDIPRRV